MSWFWQGNTVSHQEFHALVLRVKELDDELKALEDKHERLRGKFYQARGAQPPPESKAEILSRMGYMRKADQ
jgi:hypothetical protein